MKHYILTILERGPATAADLARELQVTEPELLEHLHQLERERKVLEQFGYYSLLPTNQPEQWADIEIPARVLNKIYKKKRRLVTEREVHQAYLDPKRGKEYVAAEILTDFGIRLSPHRVFESVGRTHSGRYLLLAFIEFSRPRLISARDATAGERRRLYNE